MDTGAEPQPLRTIDGVGGSRIHGLEITLKLEVDEDWVRGSAALGEGAPRPFYGWIGMVGVIEDLTSSGNGTEHHRNGLRDPADPGLGARA